MRYRLVVAAAALSLTAASFAPAYGVSAAAGPAQAKQRPTVAELEAIAAKHYIVVMDADPLVKTYGQDGLRSAAAKGRKKTLEAQQDAAMRAVGAAPAKKTYSYTNAVNGFAADLTDAQASKIARVGGVKAVLRDAFRVKQTDASPAFLGLSGRNGVWAKGWTGENVVVGVIDTGIWPEHPSFADDGSYGPSPVPPLDASVGPTCDFGNTAANPLDKPFTCNNKLLGAREMLANYKAAVGGLEPFEYDSARDGEGHGTHTASTAAGDAGVRASIFGKDQGVVSGIAPRARVIAYKALGTLGGFSSDLAAAIDQAVADGVDVVNYSIGGGPSLTGIDDLAFLFAADAGVFVAASAGNSGPGAGTIGGPATVPWLTSVGASTQPRLFKGKVVLGNGVELKGSTVTLGTRSLPLVDGAAAGSALCEIGKLDPTKVTGKIVLCLRGGNGRIAKSDAVAQAGGAGMVLYNANDVDNLFTDNFYVPSVMLDNTPGLAVKNYIASARNPRARLVPDGKGVWGSAPSMAVFSSRGPDPVAEDIIKPDVTAPGVQILAGNTPTPEPGAGAPGQLFQSIAGTSMSSPHVAGAYALIKQAHREWSAAAAKSALMTTAYQQVVDNDRTTRATPFAMGSGHIDLAGQHNDGTPFDPGLVYDAGFNEYLGFLCDADPSVFANPTRTCGALAAAGVPTKAVDLNYPSIGVSKVLGTTTVTRTVTNVGSRQATYRARISAPAGYTVAVTPSSLTLAPGASASFTVALTNVSAPIGEWRFGSLTWRDGRHDVRSPIAVKAAELGAPGLVTGTGAAGSVDVPVTFGYTGSYTAGAHGLVPATVTDGSVVQDPDQSFDPADGFSTAVQIPVSGAAHLRIALPPGSVPDPNTDLDIYLADPAGDIVAQSTAGGTDELIDLPDPVDGTYTLWVHGWGVAGGVSTTFTLYDWVLPAAAGGGNLTITAAPASAVSGTSGVVTASWTGADAAWNLGAVSHTGPNGRIALTLVEVDNR